MSRPTKSWVLNVPHIWNTFNNTPYGFDQPLGAATVIIYLLGRCTVVLNWYLLFTKKQKVKYYRYLVLVEDYVVTLFSHGAHPHHSLPPCPLCPPCKGRDSELFTHGIFCWQTFSERKFHGGPAAWGPSVSHSRTDLERRESWRGQCQIPCPLWQIYYI